jgi:glycosyltransferase involved in cell wall biosynthesis
LENALPYKALIISNKPPYPIIDGGCFAMAKFEQLLRPLFKDLYYFALSTPKHPFHADANPDFWKTGSHFYTSAVNTKIQNKHVLKYLTGSSIRVARFYQTNVEQEILQLIHQHGIEIVFFESIYAAVYLKSIKKIPGIKTFIRSHNIEHQIWEKYQQQIPRGMKRLAYKSETSRLSQFELDILTAADGNLFISDLDLAFYQQHTGKNNAISIPVQMEVSNKNQQTPGKALRLFHIGAMDWKPNVEGVEKFIQHIFPEILKKFPHTELHLAGKSMPPRFHAYQSAHIFVHGEVENAQDFMAKFDVLIVPIESGSGIRIKVLEAMAAGKPVISTVEGMAGIMARPNVECMLVSTVQEWIDAVEQLQHPHFYQTLSSNAIELINQTYSQEALINKIIPFIKNQITHGH